ncbi:MAG: DUF4340 domain-containing protein [Candidatus Acidiferrum sp.]|jgi:hypothetical protein
MKGYGLLVAAIILAALSGVLYWSNHRKPADTEVKVSADAPPKILSLNTADITKLDIRKKSVDEVSLARNDAGKWQMVAPNKAWHADQNEISAMLSTFSSLTSERLIEDKTTSLEPYGLANPSVEVDLTGKDNKTHKLLIGDATPTGDGVYVAVAGDPRVFTLSNYTKTNLDKSAKDLRDKRLLTFESDKLSRVELQAKKQDIEFGRNKDQWQIVKPKPLRADDSQVQELIRKLGDARMEVTASDDDQKKAAAEFAGGTLIATAKLTDASGTQELQVRKNKTDYYAKSSAVEGVYKVTADLGTSLDKGVDDFRNKKLFDLGSADPDKIELHDGPKSWFLTKGGDDWWLPDGKKADAFSAQGFVEQVRDLAANAFVDSGFSAATVALTVTSNGGKTIEKVEIAKSNDHYIAKRDGESALYQFDPVAVTSLEKAAEDLKPAPEPKPAEKPKK